MARLLIPAVALLLALTGCSSDGDEPRSTPSPTRSSSTRTPTPSTTPSTPAPSTALPALVIRPGSIGDARVGMTRDEWAATGLFADGAAICEGELIHWKDDRSEEHTSELQSH